MKYPDKKLDPKWITGEIPINEEIIEWLDSFGKFLAISRNDEAKPITSSQIRKFFGELKKIDADFDRKKEQVLLLSPKLAYAVGKDFNAFHQRASSKIEEFYNEINKGILEVKMDKTKFNNLVNIVESVVAYHRYHGGKI